MSTWQWLPATGATGATGATDATDGTGVARPFEIFGVPRDTLARILDALVVVLVGAGAIGRVVALHVARLWPGELRICDPDSYTAANLAGQFIGPTEIGRPKAESTAEACAKVNPRGVHGYAQARAQDVDLLPASVVLLAGDNLPLEVDVGRRCAALGIPLLQASVDGPTLTAQVRVFGNAGAGAACPACGYNAAEWNAFAAQSRFSCAGDGTGGPPTAAPAFLSSLAAELLVAGLVKRVLGLGSPSGDAIVEYNGFTGRIATRPLNRDPGCRVGHERFDRRAAPAPLSTLSLADLAARSGLRDPSFEVAHQRWIEQARCLACGSAAGIGRFAAVVRDRCANCRATLVAPEYYQHRTVTGRLLGRFQHHALGVLCSEPPHWVVVRGDGAPVLFVEEVIR